MWDARQVEGGTNLLGIKQELLNVLTLSRFIVATEPFMDHDGWEKRVVMSMRTEKIQVIPEVTWQRVINGLHPELTNNSMRSFIEARILVDQEEDELQSILAENSAAVRDDQVYYLVVQPTASCQLGCGYCGQHHTSQLLDDEHQRILVYRVANSLKGGRYKSLLVCWFGAEPLSGLSVIRELTPQLRRVAVESGSDYDAKVITNGLALTEKVADELVHEHNVTFIEVTLDGTRESHDKRRHRKNGAGSFDQILANITAFATRESLSQCSMRIRCNVDRGNADSVGQLINLLADRGLAERVTFYTAPVHSWGNDAHRNALEKERYAENDIKWYRTLLENGYSPVGLIPARKPIVCMSVKAEALLVDAYGNLFNCTEVPYVPTYGNPNVYSIGTLSEAESPDQRAVLGQFNEKIINGEVPCNSCEMLPVCGGGCPKHWREGLIPCPPPKFNIKQRLKLWYEQSTSNR